MILRKIKRLLGFGSSSSDDRRSGRDVTVQSERETADTEREGTVKGFEDDDVDAGAAVDDTADEAASDAEDDAESVGDDEVDEPVAAGTDADASTESLVDEAEASEEPAAAAEPAEAAGPESDDMTTDVDEVEPDSGGTAAPDDGTPVDEVKGIGPAYSDRLADIGITTAEELADSEAEEVADRITVPEKTVKKWLKRARKK